MKQSHFDHYLSHAWRLEVHQKDSHKIIKGVLTSLDGIRKVPIIGGIPRFVETSNYADNFGLQWNPFHSTPVVAFNIGGMPEALDHKINGYLAEPFDSNDLAEGIKWVLENPDPQSLRKAARKKAEEIFFMKNVAGQYIELYRELLNKYSH